MKGPRYKRNGRVKVPVYTAVKAPKLKGVDLAFPGPGGDQSFLTIRDGRELKFAYRLRPGDDWIVHGGDLIVVNPEHPPLRIYEDAQGVYQREEIGPTWDRPLIKIAGVQFDPADGERWLRTDLCDPWPGVTWLPVLIVTHRDRRPLRILLHSYDEIEVGEIDTATGQVESYETGTASEALQAVENWRARRDSNSRPPGS